ncbi:MAG: twin-arginine translocase subunit TatC [Microbacteriaceae bacterium]|nr:twin-arginine translocase subunit TatC [Microbacteriaceae bacterium]
MSLGSHLKELRNRFFIIGFVLIGGAVAGFFLTDFIWEWLREPVTAIAEERDAILVYPTITSSFDLKLKVSFFIGVIITSPIWMYQIWAYFLPALTRREKIYGLSFFLISLPLFAFGGVVGWYILPQMVRILSSFTPAEDASYFNAPEYFTFAFRLVIGCGIAFVIPLLLVALNFFGLLSAATIIKQWRIAIIVSLLFGAIVMPAGDLMSMFTIVVPLFALYILAWFISWIRERFVKPKEQIVV